MILRIFRKIMRSPPKIFHYRSQSCFNMQIVPRLFSKHYILHFCKRKVSLINQVIIFLFPFHMKGNFKYFSKHTWAFIPIRQEVQNCTCLPFSTNLYCLHGPLEGQTLIRFPKYKLSPLLSPVNKIYFN